MPKLGEGNFGTKFGYQIDKKNDKVGFDDATHTYFDLEDGSKYISVTTLIHNYTQPYDAQFWASYKACEFLLGNDFYDLKKKLLSNKIWKDSYLKDYSIDKKQFTSKRDEILESYKIKNREACDRGTKIHETLENLFYDKDEKHIRKYAGGGNFTIKNGDYRLDSDRAIYPEFLISYEFDQYLRISGQVDYLQIVDNQVTIRDWKSNREIKKESYFDKTTKSRQMMKYPLNNIQDVNYWHYCLQLSTYAYLLEKIKPSLKIKHLYINHFDHDGNETEYECPYLKDEVIKMLLHYRKINKSKMELDKDKPIIF